MKWLYRQPELLLTLTSFFWAGNFVIGRAVAGVIPPAVLSSLRWGVASLLLLPFALRYLRKDGQVLRRHWRMLVFLGVIGPGCFNTLSYLGLTYTEALNGLILNAAGPIGIALAAWAIFGDRIAANQFIGMVVGFLGVLFIIAKGDFAALAHFRLNSGDLLIIFAMSAWSVYTAFLRKRPPVNWQSFNVTTYAVAALSNVPFALADPNANYDWVTNWSAVAAVAYVAIFPSLLAYIFYNRGVELLGSARAGVYLFLIPVFGALLATLFLGEKLALFHALGFALIVAGVVLGGRGERVSNSVNPRFG